MAGEVTRHDNMRIPNSSFDLSRCLTSQIRFFQSLSRRYSGTVFEYEDDHVIIDFEQCSFSPLANYTETSGDRQKL